jgi:hypothetical protein
MSAVNGDDISSLSPGGQWLFAIAFWMAGLAIIALAVGWIPAPPEKFRAPHWVVGIAGVAFLAGGFAPLAARLGAGSSRHGERMTGVGSLGASFLEWIEGLS